MSLVFLVDVDDTVLELVPQWLNKSNKIWGDNVKPEHIHSWDIGSYTRDSKIFYSFLTSDLYDDINVVPNSIWGVNNLRIMGRVVFVTSGFGNNGKAKFDAMNRLGFNVYPKDFIEATDKSLIRGNYLIDDNFDNCSSFPGIGLLISKPWNVKNYYRNRFSGWIEIITYIKENVSSWNNQK